MTNKNSNTNSSTSQSNSEIDVDKIFIFRMSDGEDVITESSEIENYYTFRNPLALISKTLEIGTTVMIVPWLPVEVLEKNVTVVHGQNVMCISRPNKKMIEYYVSSVKILNEKMEKTVIQQLEPEDIPDVVEGYIEKSVKKFH